jgi:hypothetical protein
VAADFASDFGLELPVKQVDDDALVAQNVVFPRLLRHLDVRAPVAVLGYQSRKNEKKRKRKRMTENEDETQIIFLSTGLRLTPMK